MAALVRVRRLTEQEGQKLQRIVRLGTTSAVRFRRAMLLLASTGGNTVPVIARLVQADEDTVRDVIHSFNEMGLACLDPRWAGGRPRLLNRDDEDFVAETATTRPTMLGLLVRRGISFQRTKTWKESPDPDFDVKLDRIEYAINERPDRTFAFDEFGRSVSVRPAARAGHRPPGPAVGHLSPHPRDHLFPRLLLGR